LNCKQQIASGKSLVNSALATYYLLLAYYLITISYFYTMSEFSMQDAMKQFLKQSRLKTGIQALQIEDVWEQIMGKTISKYTDKIQIIQQTLFITTSVAPLKNELLYQKDQIIQRVNEALGEKIIKEVVIK